MGRIRQARRRAGLSQEELAKSSRVSPATVAQVELGHRQPQGRTLRKLAAALGVEVADLVEEENSGKEGAPSRSGHERQERLERLSQYEKTFSKANAKLRKDLEEHKSSQNAELIEDVFILAALAHDGLADYLGRDEYTQPVPGESDAELEARMRLRRVLEEFDNTAVDATRVLELFSKTGGNVRSIFEPLRLRKAM